MRNNEAVTLPAGVYWIGDPCYAIHGDDEWKHVCDSLDGPMTDMQLLGDRMIIMETEYGDDEYFDMQGNPYGVDAGLIGILPLKMVAPGDYAAGIVHRFDEPFEVIRHEGGLLQFGHVVINTNPSVHDEDDEDLPDSGFEDED